MMNSIKETCFIPQRHVSLPSANSQSSLASQVGNHTTFCIPLLQISQSAVPSTRRKSKPFSRRYYTIVGAAPKYRDETDAKGVIHNHNLKLQQRHSSDFFAEAWAKCFNKQDENGHSRFDPVHFQMIQYESFSSHQQFEFGEHGIFAECSKKIPHTTHKYILCNIYHIY